MAINKIIVVGAGPSGLILGLLLAKQGITVELLDAGAELDNQPRAAHYASPAAYELARAGVLEEVKEMGFQIKSFAFRKIDTSFLGGVDHTILPPEYPYKMVVLPLHQLGEILYTHIQKQQTAKVKWSHRVVSVGQNEGKSWVDVETPNGTQRLEADYVIGCDGASSTVRRELFGPEYPGETLNAQIIATNVYYDFEKYGYWDSNFIVHPTNWYMAARITNDGLYRVSYGDIPGLTKEEYLARQPERYQEILPGNPKPGEYQITNISPYKMQHRCAPTFRVGRIILAADAAHLCNPFGGLGLTGGIADVGCLYDALLGIHKDLADESILDKYSEIRKRIWEETIDPISRENFRLLHETDPEKAHEAPFFKLCAQAETDKELSRKMVMGLEVLRHDMTQYYTTKGLNSEGHP